MKTSRYNFLTNLGDNFAIYNILSKKYILTNLDAKDHILNLMTHLNESQYTEYDANILKGLINQGIIIEDNLNETEKVSYLFNKTKYQENTFILVISPTIECNFGCKYCFETRRPEVWDNELRNKLINFVSDISKKVKSLHVGWFGGEPTLEYDNIKNMTEIFKDICKNNNCDYSASITTNGYLMSQEKIDELERLCINKIQITIDGDEEFHNIKRPLRNGDKTFDKVFNNLLNIIDKNIKVILRINIDDENKDSILSLLNKIPKEKRNKVIINICNIFQNKNKIDTYDIYKKAIELGFQYPPFRESWVICEGSFTNSITINPDGKIGPCQMCKEKGFYFGKITNKSLKITKPSEFYKFRNVNPTKNTNCINCIKFPICLGSCTFSRYKDECFCADETLFTDEGVNKLIRLAIYNDLKHNTNNCLKIK